MAFKKLLLVLPLTFSLSGCLIVADGNDWDDDNYGSSNWRSEQNRNRTKISNLTLGVARTEVITQMGSPQFSEAFKGENGSSYQVLFYRTHREHGDGETTKDETTALVFENDTLVGWGNDALQRIR